MHPQVWPIAHLLELLELVVVFKLNPRPKPKPKATPKSRDKPRDKDKWDIPSTNQK